MFGHDLKYLNKDYVKNVHCTPDSVFHGRAIISAEKRKYIMRSGVNYIFIQINYRVCDASASAQYEALQNLCNFTVVMMR